MKKKSISWKSLKTNQKRDVTLRTIMLVRMLYQGQPLAKDKNSDFEIKATACFHSYNLWMHKLNSKYYQCV